MMRNAIEYLVIVILWLAMEWLIAYSQWSPSLLVLLVLSLSGAKVVFFGGENLQQLLEASRANTPYYRFLALMLVNMSQIILSFGFDFHCLHGINPQSFGGINPDYSWYELIFEFIYFSSLNFTFFGYGDITPQTIPAKVVTLAEIILAFCTVLFLLSDFISLRESLTPPKGK